MPRRGKMSPRDGAAPAGGRSFTLVEILVAVAILAVLAALLLPGMQSAMERVRQTKCESNLRQIGIAALGWSADNGGRICPASYPVDSLPQSLANWTGLIAPYLERTSTNTFSGVADMPVYVCPDEPGRWGYGYNVHYLSWMQLPQKAQWVTYASVARPAEVVMFTDSVYSVNKGAPFQNWRAFVRDPDWGITDSNPDFRHGGKTCNVLWVDGHVSAEGTNSAFATNSALWKP